MRPAPCSTAFVRRALILAGLGLGAWAGGCARRPPPLPEGGRILHYRIPWENAFPSDVAVDEAGRLWFTDRLTHALGVFDPATETFRRLPTPTPRSAPYGLIRDPSGALWFGESNAARLGRADPATGEVTEHEIPGLRAGPQLLAWSGGRVWFTSQRDDAFGWFDPGSGESRVWSHIIEDPYGIAAAGGAVWVAPRRGWFRRVGRRGHESGALVYRVDGLEERPEAAALPSREVLASPRRMDGGPDGRLWMTQFGAGRVAGLDPGTHDVVLVESLLQPSRPYGIVVDPWGRVWYAEQGNEVIVVYDPATGERRRAALPVPDGTVRHIAVDGERGRVWLPLSDAGVIALVHLGRG